MEFLIGQGYSAMEGLRQVRSCHNDTVLQYSATTFGCPKHKCMSLHITWNDGIMGQYLVEQNHKLHPPDTVFACQTGLDYQLSNISFVFIKHWRRDVLESIMFCQTFFLHCINFASEFMINAGLQGSPIMLQSLLFLEKPISERCKVYFSQRFMDR